VRYDRLTSEEAARYAPVWRAAETYLRARKNDIHIPLAFHWTLEILESYPDANRDVCLLAILLHDIGWWAIDMDEIIKDGFRSANHLQSDVRYRHEAEGVRLGTDVLRKTGWSEDIIAQVCEIIDGHDTRKNARHLNDRIVRDADRMWRYNITGIAIAADWFGSNPHVYAADMEARIDWFETPVGRAIAERELAITKKALMFDVI
jgi:HD superfamily phosphodiesterase